MANIMTRYGTQINVPTYEHFCDDIEDRNKIDPKQINLGSVCIVLEGESGDIEVYIANSKKEWKLFNSIAPDESQPEPEPIPIDYSNIIDIINNEDEAFIELTQSLDITAPIEISAGKNLTVDLNSQDITATGNVFNVNGGILTIEGNGNINATGNIAYVTNGGKVVIKGGTFDSTAGNFGIGAIGTGSTIEFNDGDLSTTEAGLMAFDGGAIMFNGGTLHTRDNFAIGTNGSSGRGGNLIIMNGGTIDAYITSNGYEAIGIYLPNDDTFIMNGGTIVANDGAGIVQRGGSATIRGGSITATGTAGTSGWVGDNKTKMSKSAYIYHQSANYPAVDSIQLTITGGTFNGVDHSLEILSNEEIPNVKVTGGIFNPAREV